MAVARRARADATGGLASPGDVRRGAPTLCSLDRLFVSRKTVGLPGGMVVSGMTVGFRLSAAIFNALAARCKSIHAPSDPWRAAAMRGLAGNEHFREGSFN
jgi:hypothetical protein